jgi:hypothetical protein
MVFCITLERNTFANKLQGHAVCQRCINEYMMVILEDPPDIRDILMTCNECGNTERYSDILKQPTLEHEPSPKRKMIYSAKTST